jgi:hypothetical protein
MVSEVAGEGGPDWLHVGLVNFLVQEESPEWLMAQQRTMALNRLISAGTAPGLVALNNDWTRVTGMSMAFHEASYAVAVKTVQYLVPRIGVEGVLNILRAAQTNGNTNAILMQQTGMSLSQLDLVYRNVL